MSMEAKDYLFIPFFFVAIAASIYQFATLPSDTYYLKEEYPHCVKTNPNFYKLMAGGLVVVILI